MTSEQMNAFMKAVEDDAPAVAGFIEVHVPLPERRERAVFFSYEEVLMVMRLDALSLPEYVTIMEIEGIPQDARVDRVFHDFECRGFRFVLTHPSFDPVPDGAPAPTFSPMRTAVSVSASRPTFREAVGDRRYTYGADPGPGPDQHVEVKAE